MGAFQGETHLIVDHISINKERSCVQVAQNVGKASTWYDIDGELHDSIAHQHINEAESIAIEAQE